MTTALHPESIRTLAVELNGDVVVEEWEVPAGSTELQEIPGLKGLDGSDLEIKAVMEDGEYFAILEVSMGGFHNACGGPQMITIWTS